ncbi:hypothetical protein [Alkalinema sp. FACHB-956]|nr:hypothetical protein [Alkalinema sp. FACHB-956]
MSANLPADLIDPHSLWSLWVPLVLLSTIAAAAIYFSRIKLR